jgi:hypothetical protein
MAREPYRFLGDRRFTRNGRGYRSSGSTSANTLLETASPTNDRKTVPRQDRDWHLLITAEGRRNILSLGRWLGKNVPAVEGALNEQCEYASAVFAPQFTGTDREWGDRAEKWLASHHEICDVAGWPYGMRHYRRMLLLSVLRDGEMGTLLTQTPGGYPQLQIVPSHRIGSSRSESVVNYAGLRLARPGDTGAYGEWLPDGAMLDDQGRFVGLLEFDGQTIIDGVIVDDWMRAVGYRVLIDDTSFQDVSANDCYLTFRPEFPGQLRGISVLASSMFDWQDIREARKFELIAQKAGAAISLIERNETGEAQAGADWLQLPSGGAATAGSATGLTTEVLDGGTIRYFRAGSGGGIEAFRQDRPSSQQQEFEGKVTRSNLYAMGWSVDFGLDPTKVGGAPMRVVVERINRAVGALQQQLLERACRRYDGYALSKAMKLGLLPWNDEWWAWRYQGPSQLTADAKYQSDVDLQERRTGIKTLSRIAAERGEDWMDVRIQREREAEDLLERAKRLAQKWDIDLSVALGLLELQTPNQLSVTGGQDGTERSGQSGGDAAGGGASNGVGNSGGES